jgi:hypothetical protein
MSAMSKPYCGRTLGSFSILIARTGFSAASAGPGSCVNGHNVTGASEADGDALASTASLPLEHEVTNNEIATTKVALRTNLFISNHQK